MDDESRQHSASSKVLEILLLFRGKYQYLSIDDISQMLDMPKSTVYRYIRTLVDKGFLEKSSGAQYRLGLAFLELSRTALNSNRDVRLSVFPSMERLAKQTRESVSLMRLFNQHAICIENIEGQHALRVTMERGRTQLLHAGASSRLLLAYLDEEEWEAHLIFPLERYTETTITDFETLQANLYQIREQEYSVSNGEIDAGARALAIPLINMRGDVIAALSVEAPIARMDEDTTAYYLSLLRQEADSIREQLS